jgi:hypothetical protein
MEGKSKNHAFSCSLGKSRVTARDFLMAFRVAKLDHTKLIFGGGNLF